MVSIRGATIAAAMMLCGASGVAARAQAQTPAPAPPPVRPHPAPPSIYGLWMNPYGSVVVHTGACADRLCGWIVWANQEAQNDAREGGVPRLIGTALLEQYRQQRGGSWAGTVFVPDMGRRFYSIIEQVDANSMKVKGCILHGLLCKSQVWHRIEELPHA